ncbi:MAG: LacI family DNA-binding transcriptional regulator [Anaerolineae bacterium]|nr:LacI family DNA-binding transcriptional regulator [Anaerolineae bacterium]
MNKNKIITQHDVAERAGVSRSIVSYVLNNGPRNVSDDTRQRVLDAIQELGYRPNEHAQRLKMGSDAARNSIGIVTGGQSYNLLERPYYNLILSSLYNSAHQMGQQIRFFAFFDALKDPIFFNKNIHPDEIAALILVLPSFIDQPENEELLQEITERIGNIVCLEESILDLPAVIFDRAAAARMATGHLIKLGHRRIAFLAIPDQRLIGYKQTLLEHGLPYDETLVQYFTPTQPTQSAYDITLDFINAASPPSAIFAANDESAIGAMAAIHDRGLRVPDDIAIISIDNIELSSMVRPALTTVNVPKQTIASFAIQFLITRRDFPERLPASMALPIELIVRESCGANRWDG